MAGLTAQMKRVSLFSVFIDKALLLIPIHIKL
jgi:hypothetical protein